MKALGRYSIAGFLLVLIATLGMWPFMGPLGHRSLLVAAAISWPVQIAAFALLARVHGHPTKFLRWWVVGVLGRMAIIITIGLIVTPIDSVQPTVLLLATAGFLFGLLLLEPAFFDRTRETAPIAP